jgi:peptidoglycan/LPS O-acetylase OafA/YrhL
MKNEQRFYLPQLDGLRFFAFFLVFLHHLPGVAGLNRVQAWGWIGVNLFFCLSAFLMTSLLLMEHAKTGQISPRKFFLRRIFRIWPLYFFAIFLGMLVLPALGVAGPALGTEDYAKLLRQHLMPLLLFLDNFATAITDWTDSDALRPLWSISAEEQFYVLLPMFMLLMVTCARKLWVKVLLGLMLFAVGARVTLLLLQVPYPAIFATLMAPDSFLVGMLLGKLYVDGVLSSPKVRQYGARLALLGLVILFAATVFPRVNPGSWHQLWQYAAVGIGFGLIMLYLLTGQSNFLTSLLSIRPFAWLGQISYGLYVYHGIAIAIAALLLSHPAPVWANKLTVFQWLTLCVLSLVVCVALAAVSYTVLERPFLKLKARFEVVHSRAP